MYLDQAKIKKNQNKLEDHFTLESVRDDLNKSIF